MMLMIMPMPMIMVIIDSDIDDDSDFADNLNHLKSLGCQTNEELLALR